MPRIISTPAQLKPYLPTAYTNELANMPDFGTAEEQHLLPIIGQTMYENLQSAEPADIYVDLLPYARAVIAPFAYLNNLAFMQVMLSDSGLKTAQGDNERGAFKWEYKEVKEALADMGFSAQERLISYLTLHKDDYPYWASADYNNGSNFGFIRNGKELSEAIPIVQPHRCFMHLKSLFQEVGELDFRSVLGDDYYDELNGKVLSNDIPEEEATIVRHLRMAAGRLALAKAALQANVRFNAGNGFTIADILKEQPEEGRKGASQSQINSFVQEMRVSAASFLDKVSKQLNNNASAEIYPVYFASSTYSNPHNGGMKLNNDRKGFFSM
jgi:hypothetical protein